MERKKRVGTPDCWFPTASDGKVEVSIHKVSKRGSHAWRVSVWGDDDFGLEKNGLTINEAFDMFRGIKDGVTQQDLRNRGFVGA